ncbi:MAG: 16S rRNA (cytidine(1402)-2'-O)-methyltransferase [Candidatus Spyradocola sp.]
MACLYVVGTPIGNLSEVSPRVRETLEGCEVILAEDTRVTQKLLSALNISGKQLISCHQHNEAGRAEQVVQRMLAEDLAVAMVTDAGTPCISDPGYRVVAAAAAAGIPVQPVSGPSAVVDALSVSGLNVDGYAFFGFLPRQGRERDEAFERIRGCKMGVAVVYESPHRVKALLADVARELSDPQVSLSCDLTKLHELTERGAASEVLDRLNANPNAEKGEYVCCIDLHDLPEPETTVSGVSAHGLLLERLFRGMRMKDAVREVSALPGYSRNEVYKASLEVAAFLDGEDE